MHLRCEHNILISSHYPGTAVRTSFLAARSRLLLLLFPLSDISSSVLISPCLMSTGRFFFFQHFSLLTNLFSLVAVCYPLLVARCSAHAAWCSILAIRCSLHVAVRLLLSADQSSYSQIAVARCISLLFSQVVVPSLFYRSLFVEHYRL